MRALINLGSNFLNITVSVMFLIVFCTPIGAKAEENKDATAYVRGLANGALENAEPTAKRVAYWTQMINEHLNVEHIASLGANAGGKPWKNLTVENRGILKNWLVIFATSPESKFMQLISNSVIRGVDVKPCEIATPSTCNSRVTFTLFNAEAMKLTVVVTKNNDQLKVDNIIYQDTIHVRSGMADSLAEALRKGEIRLGN